jgi:hypothetical protein
MRLGQRGSGRGIDTQIHATLVQRGDLFPTLITIP